MNLFAYIIAYKYNLFTQPPNSHGHPSPKSPGDTAASSALIFALVSLEAPMSPRHYAAVQSIPLKVSKISTVPSILKHFLKPEFK
jgi:hypothetical protein